MPDEPALEQSAIDGNAAAATAAAAVCTPNDAYERLVIDLRPSENESCAFRVLGARECIRPPSAWKGRPADWTKTIEEITGHYERIDSEGWGALVNLALTSIPRGPGICAGNCFGWVTGEFGEPLMSSRASGLIPEFMRPRLRGKITPETDVDAAYRGGLSDGSIGADELNDFMMFRELHARPVEREDRALYALYSGHIAVRLPNPSGQWLSKLSGALPAVVHENASQLLGTQLGETVRFYSSSRRPKHIIVGVL